MGRGAQPAHEQSHGQSHGQSPHSSASAGPGAQRGLLARGTQELGELYFTEQSLFVAHDAQALSWAPGSTAKPTVCGAEGGEAGEREEKDASSLWCCKQRVHLTVLSRPPSLLLKMLPCPHPHPTALNVMRPTLQGLPAAPSLTLSNAKHPPC